jgi:hypothetical protein
VAEGRSLLSQRCTVPVWPERVRVTDELKHMGEVPETVPPTESGLTVTSKVLEGEGHLGSLVYWLITLTVLVPAVPPILTVICRVPCPPVIVQPAGTVQMYSVVPPKGIVGGLAATENTCPVALIQTSDGPVTGPGRLSSSLMIRSIREAGPSHPLTPLVSVT